MCAAGTVSSHWWAGLRPFVPRYSMPVQRNRFAHGSASVENRGGSGNSSTIQRPFLKGAQARSRCLLFVRARSTFPAFLHRRLACCRPSARSLPLLLSRCRLRLSTASQENVLVSSGALQLYQQLGSVDIYSRPPLSLCLFSHMVLKFPVLHLFLRWNCARNWCASDLPLSRDIARDRSPPFFPRS